MWYPVGVIFTAVIKILWKFAINAVVLWVIGQFLIPSLPHDYVTLAKIAGILAVVNYFF
ncbi:MAG: hypothetical protein AAB916_02370 [Patescibacteria group bacterium]